MGREKAETVSLGFTEQRFAPGAHVCQIFGDDDERQDAVLRFLLAGSRDHERVASFSDKTREESVATFFEANATPFAERRAAGAISVQPAGPVYFQDGCFSPERMLAVLTAYHDESVRGGFPACRVIGEMPSQIRTVRDGSRLMEYECRVSILLRTHPITAVCQYDARAFEGATLLDVLKVHPLMVVRGFVVNNPFFVEPEQYLAR